MCVYVHYTTQVLHMLYMYTTAITCLCVALILCMACMDGILAGKRSVNLAKIVSIISLACDQVKLLK